MAIFKENVIDILDDWGFYPLKDPCSEDPAFNSGQVQIRCFINNVCPFYKSPKKEDSLVFNYLTYLEIKDRMPSGVGSVIDTTPEVEGLYFKPRQVFRHNYMYEFRSQFALNSATIVDLDEIMANFDTYYGDISLNQKTNPTVGSDKTRYIAEFSWFPVPSVFDDKDCPLAVPAECATKANWKYVDQYVPESEMTDRDIRFDYQSDYWFDYYDSFEDDGQTLKEGETKRIEKLKAQMPVQTRIYSGNKGIHWKIMKRTPLFKGEDFFIRFYKQAIDPVVIENTLKPVKFKSYKYQPLDIHSEARVIINGFERKVNHAIRPPERDSESNADNNDNLNTYDFYTQPYYIIELNPNSDDTNYFIIIPYRGNPTFVHFFNGNLSKRFGPTFDGISGAALIEADYFDIIVRNHLGRLVIQFKGDFPKVRPWIVERKDWDLENTPEGDSPYMLENIKTLVVPRGRMSIWGGNIRCGFIFGPLQYSARYISFVYPPRDLDFTKENMTSAFQAFSPIKMNDISNQFNSNLIWLPLSDKGAGLRSNHHIHFDAADKNIETGVIGDDAPVFSGEDLFTQDAQFYYNYDDKKTGEWKKGYFYQDFPIRDPSDHYGGIAPGVGGAPSTTQKPLHVKTSNIVVKKYQYFNNFDARWQGFNLLIGMMAGDHVFTSNYWINGGPVEPADKSVDILINTHADMDDSNWFLPDCKTPIMTSLRLLSDAGEDPRWADGTTIDKGINRDPTKGQSSYFVDATDHVMSFSHSWSTSALTSMEHTGSIKFYLNHDMPVDNNVTSDLLALQDKTFYIEVWGGYDNCNYTRVNGFYKMFTGICDGGSVSYEYGKNVMTCKLQDYSVVLKGMKFFNSPWFDGMKDIVAINEIMGFAGFRDQGVYDPGRLIRDLSEASTNLSSSEFFNHFDGRVFKFQPLGLPSGYSRLHQPLFKFNDGDPFIDAISKISKLSSKIFYFDEYGIAHYEDFQDIVEKDFLGEVPLIPLYHFTTNPEVHGGQIVFNKVERTFDVSEIYNHIKILSNTPDRHALIKDYTKRESLENPEITGFIGYLKTQYQQESMFGSKEAIDGAIKKYSVGFKPKINVKFETYGIPLRATDIVAIEGEIVRVVKVDHAFDPESNRWWMNVECEKYQPIDTISL